MSLTLGQLVWAHLSCLDAGLDAQGMIQTWANQCIAVPCPLWFLRLVQLTQVSLSVQGLEKDSHFLLPSEWSEAQTLWWNQCNHFASGGKIEMKLAFGKRTRGTKQKAGRDFWRVLRINPSHRLMWFLLIFIAQCTLSDVAIILPPSVGGGGMVVRNWGLDSPLHHQLLTLGERFEFPEARCFPYKSRIRIIIGLWGLNEIIHVHF